MATRKTTTKAPSNTPKAPKKAPVEPVKAQEQVQEQTVNCKSAADVGTCERFDLIVSRNAVNSCLNCRDGSGLLLYLLLCLYRLCRGFFRRFRGVRGSFGCSFSCCHC